MSASPLSRRHAIGRAIAAAAGALAFFRVPPAQAGIQGQPYVGEIRMFAGDWAPAGWMMCEGQLLPISENDTLFQLIGTMYGGDGQETFALPDLRGRVPMHASGSHTLGEPSGLEEVWLSVNQIPSHTHGVGATDSATSDDPTGRYFARNSAGDLAYAYSSNTQLAPGAALSAGGSQAHTNMQPHLPVTFIISLYGNFPQQ